MNPPSRRSRWCLSIFAVGLLYLNCAVIWQHLAKRWQAPALPISSKVAGVFFLFGVFANYETNNHELVLWGYTETTSGRTNGWKPLPTEEYFPFKPGVRQQLLWSRKFIRVQEPERLWRAWARSGKQILARHNRTHPETPISQVALENRTWPRSPAGVYILQKPGTLETNFWIVATNR